MTEAKAVVFDLWGTLIGLPADVRGGAFRETAAALGYEAEDLEPHWKATRLDRETNDLQQHLRRLGEGLGESWSEETIERAVAARMQSHAVCFAEPFPDGRAAIEQIRGMGLATALVSNCTSEVREQLVRAGMDAWFDHIVLSSDAGVMKPSPEIYRMAAERLGLHPAQCLFVGDGGDTELEGAAAVGMRPVLYSPTGKESAAGFPTVASHLELMAHINSLG